MRRLIVLLLVVSIVGCQAETPTAPPPSPTPTQPPPTETPRPTLTLEPSPTFGLTATPTSSPLLEPISLGATRNRIPTRPTEVTISADGDRIAYISDSRNIVAGVAGDIPRAYVYDVSREQNILASPPTAGADTANGWTAALDMTADGRTVAYFVFSPALPGCLEESSVPWCGALVIVDIETDTAEELYVGADWPIGLALDMTPDGRYIAAAVPGAYTREGLFVYDRETETYTTIIEGDTEEQLTGADTPVQAVAISDDGCIVAYASEANTETDTNNAFDVYRYDCETEESTRISVPQGDDFRDSGLTRIDDSAVNGGIALSDDGRYIAFPSYAPDMTGDFVLECADGPCGQVYRYDAVTDTMEIASVNNEGDTADGTSFGQVAMSPDGRYVGFTSQAASLYPGECPASPGDDDQPCAPAVYVRDMLLNETHIASIDLGVNFNPPVSRLLTLTDEVAAFWTSGFFGSSGFVFTVPLDELGR